MQELKDCITKMADSFAALEAEKAAHDDRIAVIYAEYDAVAQNPLAIKIVKKVAKAIAEQKAKKLMVETAELNEALAGIMEEQ